MRRSLCRHMLRREFIILAGGAARRPETGLLPLVANWRGTNVSIVWAYCVRCPEQHRSSHSYSMGCGGRASSRVEILSSTPGVLTATLEQYEERAALLIQSGAEVLVCGGDLANSSSATGDPNGSNRGHSRDMVASGLVPSLARPGGNTTGVSVATTELDGKRQELLLDSCLGARRIAALFDPDSKSATQLQTMVDEARIRGLELRPIG